MKPDLFIGICIGAIVGFSACVYFHTSGRAALDYLQLCVDRTHWRKSMPHRNKQTAADITHDLRELRKNS